MSFANLTSSNDRPPSRKSKPKCSISSRQFAIDISNTEPNSRGLKTHPCRTPPCIAKDLLQPLLPTTCPCWFRYKFLIIQIICSERPCSERARHSAGQCTRSKAFDKSRPNWHVCVGKFVQDWVRSHQMFFHTYATPKTMLFFWLMRFQLGFHPSQNHVCKKFVKQSYGCNRAVFGRNLSTHGFRQHFERCFPPISWYLSSPHQTIELNHQNVNERVRRIF